MCLRFSQQIMNKGCELLPGMAHYVLLDCRSPVCLSARWNERCLRIQDWCSQRMEGVWTSGATCWREEGNHWDESDILDRGHAVYAVLGERRGSLGESRREFSDRTDPSQPSEHGRRKPDPSLSKGLRSQKEVRCRQVIPCFRHLLILKL